MAHIEAPALTGLGVAGTGGASESEAWHEAYESAAFQALLSTRRQLAWRCALTMGSIGACWVLLAAFAPGVMARSLSGDLTVGWAMTGFVVLSVFAVTWYYARSVKTKVAPLRGPARESALERLAVTEAAR